MQRFKLSAVSLIYLTKGLPISIAYHTYCRVPTLPCRLYLSLRQIQYFVSGLVFYSEKQSYVIVVAIGPYNSLYLLFWGIISFFINIQIIICLVNCFQRSNNSPTIPHTTLSLSTWACAHLHSRRHSEYSSSIVQYFIIMVPPPISPISCFRCASFGLQCCVLDSPLPSACPKFLCNQCYAAGLDQCIFPPSTRLIDNISCNSKCISCSAVKSKCIFVNPTDDQCVRCSKLHIPCGLKLNGKFIRRVFIYHVNITLLSC